MYLVWGDLTIDAGSTLTNNGKVTIINGSLNELGSLENNGIVDIINTNLEYILQRDNETGDSDIIITDNRALIFDQGGSPELTGSLISDVLTEVHIWTMPDKTGTVALLSDIIETTTHNH